MSSSHDRCHLSLPILRILLYLPGFTGLVRSPSMSLSLSVSEAEHCSHSSKGIEGTLAGPRRPSARLGRAGAARWAAQWVTCCRKAGHRAAPAGRIVGKQWRSPPFQHYRDPCAPQGPMPCTNSSFGEGLIRGLVHGHYGTSVIQTPLKQEASRGHPGSKH